MRVARGAAAYPSDYLRKSLCLQHAAATRTCLLRPPNRSLQFAAGDAQGRNSSLLAGRAVDRLAQQIGMPVVAGVLLEHMQIDPAKRARPRRRHLVQAAA